MDENEKWVGIFFRLPEEEKEAFLEAVAKVYGVGKGTMGKCLRDLVKDFVEYVNMSTDNPTTARLRAIERVITKAQSREEYMSMDFTHFEKGTWKTYEDLLSVMWPKYGRYPETISKKDFYIFLSMVRGKSRTTQNRWKKALIKAGLISEKRNIINFHYPVIYDVIDVYSVPDEAFYNFHFAIISPHGDDMILTYTIPIRMNPDHVAVISVRVTPQKITLQGKEFVPIIEYHRFIENMERVTPYTGNVPLFRVINALRRKDNWKPADATMTIYLYKYLIDRFNAPADKLLPGAIIPEKDIELSLYPKK